MMIRQLLPLVCISLIACSNNQVNDRNNGAPQDTTVQRSMRSVWERQVISEYDRQFPRIYTYSIRWSKGDSAVTYRVISKFKDTLVPIELEHLAIKAKDMAVEANFINKRYNQNLPGFSHDFSDIDKNKIGHLNVLSDSMNLRRSPEEREKFEDSIADLIFK